MQCIGWGTWLLRVMNTFSSSELVLPHHAFYGSVGLTTIFSICFLIVFDVNFTFNREVDQLAYWHSMIYFYRLLYGDLQRPVSAKTNIPFSGSGMYINAKSSR